MNFGTIEEVLSSESRCCVMHGDCRDLLKLVPDNSVDSIATDCPYEIRFGRWDSSGIAYDVGMWSECLRVLKPGAFLTTTTASRTYHRIACAIEDAGFLIHPQLEMIYGSGAAHGGIDISKAIDKLDGTTEQRPVIGSYRISGNAATPTSEKGGTFAVGAKNSPSVELQRTLGATERSRKWDGFNTQVAPGKEPLVFAQKPIEEGLSIVENVLKWGTGSLNVDGCRIATDFSERGEAWKRSGHSAKPEAHKIAHPPGQGMILHPKGRWPKTVVFLHDYRCIKLGEKPSKTPIINRHVGGPRYFGDAIGAQYVSDGGDQTTETIWDCHPDCPCARLAEQSGPSKSRSGKPRIGVARGEFGMTATGTEYDDEGSATRYFTQLQWIDADFDYGFRYIKKPNSCEREGGCEEIEPTDTGRHNDHETIKSIEFMRWNIRLITPPGGVTLSPFYGSGTDGIAAAAEGMRSIGFDFDPADPNDMRHIEISKARISFWAEDDCRRLRANIKPKLLKKDDRQRSLFGEVR